MENTQQVENLVNLLDGYFEQKGQHLNVNVITPELLKEAQKHPELFKELILDNTNEGDLVFDPCAGGLTTALAAAPLDRKYICCELNTEFSIKGTLADSNLTHCLCSSYLTILPFLYN